MKKKILLIFVALLLPLFLVINSFANSKNDENDQLVEVNSDIMIDSPLFTAKETQEKYNYDFSLLEMSDFEMEVSNDNFELWVNEENAAIRIKNKATNYVWASDILHLENYSINKSKERQYTSAFTMNYYDGSNKAKSCNSSDSEITIKTSKTNDTVKFSVNNTKARIKFYFTVTLTNEGIEFNLPYESINETADCRLTSIALYENFGAAYGKSVKSGYLFIPSGNGGLIRYEKTPSINQTYTASYYGTDANRNNNKESSILSLPIFGMVHGYEQNAVLARIKNGSGIAAFNYTPTTVSNHQINNTVTGETTGFHFAYNTFYYRQPYNMPIPGSEPILMIPEDLYQTDVTVTYTFLSGEDADYVGLAHAYQNQLIQEGMIKASSNSGSGNVHLDILGGETEKGIVFDEYIKMTTTDQLLEINDELTKKFDNKFLYTLRGFNKKGYSNQSSTNIKFDSRLGKLSDLDSLDYYMYYNPVETYNSKNQAPSNTLVNIFNEESYITVDENSKYKFYTDVDTIKDGVKEAMDKYPNSVAFDALGYRLYGDKNNNYSRQDVINMYQELINTTSPMFKPNEYMLNSTSHYMNMPLYHDRVRFITDSVPFLQIALRGYIDYYSTYLNFSTNQEIDLLKCIEYGSNLAYLISYEESHLLANSLSSHLYATTYSSNKDLMFEQINDANIVLNHIKNQTIVDRNIIESGIVEVVYSNNVKIYVNYTSEDYSYNNTIIPTMGYKVV